MPCSIMYNPEARGIYPDLLHICDLAIFVDMTIASSLLCWTDRRDLFDGRSRDERLIQLYAKYLEWCKENRHLNSINTFSPK